MPDAPEERVATDAKRGLGGGHVARACLALALAAAWTATAAAQVPPGAVLVVRAPPGERDRAHSIASRILAGALGDGRDLVAPPAAPTSAVGEDGWLTRALLEAEDHYSRFGLEDARAVLDAALARLDRDGTAGATTRDLVELFLLRARVAQAGADPDAARAAARAALAIEPGLVVDEERHPPTLTELVLAERASVARCPVSLLLAPEAALASIDGAPFGPPPATLGCGTHWVVVVAPAYRSQSFRLELLPDAAVRRVELTLDAGAAFALGSEPFSTPPEPMETAANSLDRELVFLDVATQDGALVVSLDGRRVRAPLGATPDEIVALLRAATRVDGGLDPGLVAGVSVAIGVALAVAIGIAVGVATASPPTSFELRGQLGP